MLRTAAVRIIPVKKTIWVNKNEDFKIIRTLRFYSSKGEKRGICPPPPPKKSSSTGTVVTLGAIALIGGSTLAYAKYDNDFREQLVCWFPFTDKMIAVIFGEQKIEISNPFKSIIDGVMKPAKKIDDSKQAAKSEVKEYIAPTPILPIIEKDKKPDPECYAEIRVEKIEPDGDEPTVIIGGSVKSPAKSKAEARALSELEEAICKAATDAVNSYSEAVVLQKKFNKTIEEIAESNIGTINHERWVQIKEEAKKKNETIEAAERKAEQAISDFKKLKEEIQEADLETTDTTKQIVINNISRVEDDIKAAQSELTDEKKKGSVRDKYWKKVEKSRQMFQDELESLFPNIDITQKKLKVNEEDLDLFLLYIYSTVLFYQRELAKVDTIGKEKKRAAFDAIKNGEGGPFSAVQVCEMIDEEKRKLTLCFQQQCLKLRKQTEDEYRDKMKTLSQAFADHLDEAVRLREAEITRELSRKFDEQLEAERCKFKLKLAAMLGRLQGLDQAVKLKKESASTAKNAQVLWSTCQSLTRALKAGCPGIPWQEQLRPLEPEINAVREAAGKDDMVTTVLDSVPNEALTRGVYPEDALRERFLTVEKVARNLALVPDGGAALPVYLLSYIQGMFLLKSASPIPAAELNDEKTDFSKLNTHDVLQRARYWLDRGNFEQTLKYMNLLKGAPRCVAKQWMNETRILLETQQAANTLMAHAASIGLMYL